MAARKLQQEIDKCFKKVHEGVAEFDSIYEKIEQSNNQAQKEKLEDNLKREIKKLQRQRDQIKTWAASNDIKDKGPLLEHRRLIETQMERFKAVEKAMKTKAYSKEGLSASAKLDPREQARMEASDFLNEMVAELETQIEALEAEGEQLQATMKKGKGHSAKAERMATIEHIIERHKWHQGKLELIRRSLENGGVEPDQVTDLEESIRYYVTDGQNDDFNEDEELYDDLALEDEEEQYGMNTENDKGSSQDTQSVQDEPEPEPTTRPGSIPGGKSRPTVDQAGSTGRRPSTQLKSPLPTLATVNTTPLPTMASNVPASTVMKPAAVPTRPAGEGLKYASAAAAAAAADKAGVGIAPLPPPPGAPAGAPSSSQAKTSTTTTSSPSTASIQLASQAQAASLQQQRAQDTDRYVTPAEAAAASIPAAAAPAQAIVKKADREATAAKASSSKSKTATPSASSTPSTAAAQPSAKSSSRAAQTNGISKAGRNPDQHQEEESVYHLPRLYRILSSLLRQQRSGDQHH